MRAQEKKRFLANAEASQSATQFAETFPKIPALVVDHRRCGRSGCRCERGQLHGPYFYLRWREGSRQRRRYVKAAEVAAVQAALSRRRRARAVDRAAFAADLTLLRRLTELSREMDATLGTIGRHV
jgi:hypothetical protein